MSDDVSETSSQYERKAMEIRPFFEKVRTFGELRKAYISYLEGKIPATPTYVGDLCPDTKSQINTIIKINRRGFLTIDSQDGRNDDSSSSRLPSEAIQKQRAYLNGYMRVSTFKKMVEKLLQSDIVHYGASLMSDTDLSMRDSGTRYPVTIDSQTKQIYTAAYFTSAYCSDDWRTILDACPDLECNPQEIMFVLLVDPTWGRSNHLAELVAKALKH